MDLSKFDLIVQSEHKGGWMGDEDVIHPSQLCIPDKVFMIKVHICGLKWLSLLMLMWAMLAGYSVESVFSCCSLNLFQLYYVGKGNSPVYSLALTPRHLYVALDWGIHLLDFSRYWLLHNKTYSLCDILFIFYWKNHMVEMNCWRVVILPSIAYQMICATVRNCHMLWILPLLITDHCRDWNFHVNHRLGRIRH